MPPFRAFWLSLILAVVCVVTFAISYYTIAEGARSHPHAGYNPVWLLGSPLLVGIVAIVVFYFALEAIQENKRTMFAIGGGGVLAALYFYLLMFVVLNTLGS